MYQAVGESDPMLGGVRNSPTADPEKPGSTAGSGSIRTMRLEAPTRRCNDVLFAILFIANVLTVAVFAFWKGIPAVVKHAKAMMDDDGNDIAGPEEDGDYTKVFALSAALVAISIAVSAFWMRFLMAYATSLIRLALWLNVVVIVVFAIISFSVQPIMSGIMLVGAGLNVWFIFAVRSRIAFAAANLKSACAAVGEHMGVFWVALFMIVKQFLWLMLWSLCAIGVYQHFKDVDPECDKAEAARAPNAPSHFCGGTSAGLAMFFLLLSVYWGQQVIQNVLTCTTAGVVATWWYQPESDKVTFSAFYRSLTTSFGSICFGSLIVAVLHALRSMAALAKEKAAEDNNMALACVACLAECVLGCIERIMEYINQWAYVYVGIYGYDFRTSGKAVTDLFMNRGFTAVINDDLTQTALTIGAFGVGFVGLVVGLLMVQFSPPGWFAALGDKQSAFGVLGAIGFISGLGMAMVLANVIITALHTVFVCFAEDPIALSRNHPHEYEILVSGWREFHGEALHHAYGSAV